MRFSLRRATLAVLLGFSGALFLVALHSHTPDVSQLSQLSLGVPGNGRRGEDVLPLDGARVDILRQYDSLTTRVVKTTTTPRHVQQTASPVRRDLWFPGKDKWRDRILDQMSFIPESYSRSFGGARPMVRILAPGGVGDTPLGQDKFLQEQCPVNRCFLTLDTDRRADVVLIQNTYEAMNVRKLPNQIWVLWALESPINLIDLRWLKDRINWTATYRSDSTIVTPYEKFVPFSNFTELPATPARNYARGKTKMVAWFVSNCATNNDRLEYVQELRRHVDVDVYGACGVLQCPRNVDKSCDALLSRRYKFYLSFENSNCEYYITEKFFWNALLYVKMRESIINSF